MDLVYEEVADNDEDIADDELLLEAEIVENILNDLQNELSSEDIVSPTNKVENQMALKESENKENKKTDIVREERDKMIDKNLEINKENEAPVESVISENSQNTPISHLRVPSPFKKCLFWPEASASTTKRKSKEKVPTVATSEQWKQYHIMKEEEKKKKKLKKKAGREKVRKR